MPAAEQPHPDRILAATELVTIGAFRCPVDHPLFRDSGPIRQACFVFPRTAVAIAHDTGSPFLADPTLATLYNSGQRYERRAVSPEGDCCDWFGVSPAVLFDVVRAVDATVDERARPIRHQTARVTPQLYVRQRRFFRSVREGLVDPLAIDEVTLSLLAAVLSGAYAGGGRRTLERPRSDRRDLAEAARELVARHYTARLTLGGLAARLGCSAFYLCRTFRHVTGMRLHTYQTELRLRTALEAIESGARLADLALDLGFASHSHFTEAFRRTFGVPPSRVLAARRGRSSIRLRPR